MHRAELTALERAEHVSEWVRLTAEKAAPEVSPQIGEKLPQQGVGRGIGGGRPEGGINAAVRELGISKGEAHRALSRTDRIAPEVREHIRQHMPEIADSGVELDALASLPPRQQREAVVMVQGGGADFCYRLATK